MSNINKKILLILPAFNEESSILDTCQAITDYNKNNNTKFDYIVINDGSKDNTKKICKNNNLPHINLKINSGIGSAVQAGYKYAHSKDYDIAVQFDADGQHDINYVKNIIAPIINKKADLVIGSRFINLESSKFKSTKGRRIGINVISWWIKLLSGKKIYDTTSGFRAVNKNIISNFARNYPQEFPEPISIITLLRNNYIIKEIPVSMNNRLDGESSIKKFKSIYYMFNVCLLILIESIGGHKNDF